LILNKYLNRNLIAQPNWEFEITMARILYIVLLKQQLDLGFQ